MNGKSVAEDHLETIPIREIVARESTNTLAVDDPIVTQAVKYIRSVAPVYPIHVSEVAARSPLSLSGFNKHFVQQMGLTPKEEIKRVRLAKVQVILKNTRKDQPNRSGYEIRKPRGTLRFSKGNRAGAEGLSFQVPVHPRCKDRWKPLAKHMSTDNTEETSTTRPCAALAGATH